MAKKAAVNGKKKKFTFSHEYKWWIIGSVIILFVTYVLIYVCFLGNGFLPTGSELEKKDWLAFLGGYLSFAGTLIISLIAILQNKYFSDREKKRIADERKKTVQPILSVNIAGIGLQINGTAEAFGNCSSPMKRNRFRLHIQTPQMLNGGRNILLKYSSPNMKEQNQVFRNGLMSTTRISTETKCFKCTN